MILEFYVSNYLSIKDGLKISFVATSLKDSLSESNDMIALSDTGLMLLRSAVIYGANASGKSIVTDLNIAGDPSVITASRDSSRRFG